jgi:hypothetical protein
MLKRIGRKSSILATVLDGRSESISADLLDLFLDGLTEIDGPE